MASIPSSTGFSAACRCGCLRTRVLRQTLSLSRGCCLGNKLLDSPRSSRVRSRGQAGLVFVVAVGSLFQSLNIVVMIARDNRSCANFILAECSSVGMTAPVAILKGASDSHPAAARFDKFCFLLRQNFITPRKGLRHETRGNQKDAPVFSRHRFRRIGLFTWNSWADCDVCSKPKPEANTASS